MVLTPSPGLSPQAQSRIRRFQLRQNTKSHLNRSPILSGYERAAIDVLEDSEVVEFYTPNGKFTGFTIPYRHNGEDLNYEPDFIVRLRGGKTLVVEIKGGGGRIHNPDAVEAKRAASTKWCTAVSNMGSYGTWEYVFCDAKDEVDLKRILREVLGQYTGEAVRLPYRVVPTGTGVPGTDCVPVISLRTVAAGKRTNEDADLFGGTLGHELATWDGHPEYTKGMFVAKVFGDAMTPRIPNGAYCLFRLVGEGFDPHDKVVLVRDAAIRDHGAGGGWTVRKCIYGGAPDPDKGIMQHYFELWADNDAQHPAFIVHVGSRQELDVRAEFIGVLPKS